jgi:polysaccharide pyruvyl transferase WcaK-like protein|tara:strand:+ start:184 stop:393 length:210 start_codon:yes stop_codon:yes gene_type:complete
MTKTYLKIEGSDSFVRDTESGAIININTSEFDKLKKIREYKKNKENEISELQNEVSEIKSLLKQLLEKS